MTTMEVEDLKALLDELCASAPRRLDAPGHPSMPFTRRHPFSKGAVYLFSTPDDQSWVYVGETGAYRDRLRFHGKSCAEGGGKQDLACKVAARQSYPQDVVNYMIRYVPIEGKRNRLEFEKFVKKVLNPPFNEK